MTDPNIRTRLLRALAQNRAPGFHFPGYFLDLQWPAMTADTVTQTMASGPHCTTGEGAVHLTALGVMMDAALATAPRLVIEPGARQATVHLNAQFTGHPAVGELRMDAKLEGFTATQTVRQSLARGTLYAGGRTVAYAGATFVVLPPPPGVTLAPLPWQDPDAPPAEPLTAASLDDREARVLAAFERALRRSRRSGAFIEHFWEARPVATPYGARCTVRIAPHIGNRVGHVQGGILFGLAAGTAQAAAPRHPLLSTISAWYISPGQGESLRIRSTVVHGGRSFAVVKTDIRNADGSLVLEAMSNHAAG